jgi:secondary thiamine-phosphate synthase enzyme
MTFSVKTEGHYDFADVTERVRSAVRDSGIRDGVATIFVSGSTAAITTMEYEQGLIRDMKNLFESWAPENADYEHHKRWGDHNGAAHLKAAIVGPDLSVPLAGGELQLGTWQQIVLIDFDERGRDREVTVLVARLASSE